MSDEVPEIVMVAVEMLVAVARDVPFWVEDPVSMDETET